MKKLKDISLYDNLHFILIFALLFILTFKYWYIVFLLILYVIFIIVKTELFGLCLILSVLLSITSVQYIKINIPSQLNGLVIECDEKEAVVFSKYGKVLIYHDNNLNIGDYGNFMVKEKIGNQELFDYEEYLSNLGIKKVFNLTEFEYMDNYFVVGKIQNFFIKLVNKHPSKYKDYISTLIFADNRINNDIKNGTLKLGISHLLAVSGMHISLLVLLLEFLLKKIFYFEKYINVIISVILVCYLIICNFSLTVTRAILMYLLTKYFEEKELIFTKIDVLSMIGILFLLISPKYLFLLSFQLSFIVSFIIIIFVSNFKIENKIVQTFFVSLVAFIVTLPFIIMNNYEFNLLSIVLSPIFVLLFEFVLYPVTILLSIFPFLSGILDYVFTFFEIIVGYLADNSTFNIIIGSISLIELIIYEVITFFLLSSFEVKRGRMLFISVYLLFISFLYFKPSFNQFYQVKFYNVGQGDSALIIYPRNTGYVLIDCYNNITKHLKHDGIKRLDLIFLSHGHSDHVGALEEVLNTFRTKSTYTSFYDDTKNIKEIKSKYNIGLLKSGDSINFKDITFDVLGPIKKYQNENDNSLVIKFMIDNISYLFTGDIEKSEKDIINKYHSVLKTDVLKASHHGSSTASSKEFLEVTNPKYIVISVGKNNIYNLPNNKLLLSYKNLYRTDKNGSITFIHKKRFKIKTSFT